MFRDETSFLPEQLHRQNVSGYHDDHGYVEGDQRAEHEKRSVVDHACSRPWHNIQRIYYAWGKRLLQIIKLIYWIKGTKEFGKLFNANDIYEYA